jgi:hypothetical protein
LSVLDRRLVEDVAAAIRADAGLVEKDWHVVRAIGVIAAAPRDGAIPVFSGGTSLSKAWGLIQRFSEDIDFKVAMPPAASGSKAHKERSAYRERVLGALTASDFELAGKPEVGNQSRFFSANFFYRSEFGTGPGLRPHIRIEMSFREPALTPIDRPIRSLIAEFGQKPAEVSSFPCIDPIETAADKMSALAWRVRARKRGAPGDDATIIRHLHDLAALAPRVSGAAQFKTLVKEAVAADAGRGGAAIASSDPASVFADMIARLSADELWASEYTDFVREVSFVKESELISFDQALAAVVALGAVFEAR